MNDDGLAVTLSFFRHCESRSWLTVSSSQSPPCCCCCCCPPCCCWWPSGRGCCAVARLWLGAHCLGQRCCKFWSQFWESLGARDHLTLTCNGSLFIVDHWITFDLRLLSSSAFAHLLIVTTSQIKEGLPETFWFTFIVCLS